MNAHDAVTVIEKNYLCEIESKCIFNCYNCKYCVTPAELKEATEMAIKALIGGRSTSE